MTFDQFVQLLDVLKWPVVVFALILIAMLLFRAQFAGLLSRVTSIGKEGLKAAPAVANQQNQADPNKEAKDLLKAPDSPILLEQEQAIRTHLEKQGTQNAGEKVDLLVRYLAICQLVVSFEETYRLIFGSQIYILKRVNESKVLKRSVIEEHFRYIEKRFPVFADWDADRYMSFLLTFYLLLYQNEQYAITPFGIEFLTWMARRGRSRKQALIGLGLNSLRPICASLPRFRRAFLFPAGSGIAGDQAAGQSCARFESVRFRFRRARHN